MGEGDPPIEYKLLKSIDRFGNLAVDRELSYKEIRRMTVTENIIQGYWSREKAMETDIVEWRKQNKGISRLLDYAEKLVNNGEHN